MSATQNLSKIFACYEQKLINQQFKVLIISEGGQPVVEGGQDLMKNGQNYGSVERDHHYRKSCSI